MCAQYIQMRFLGFPHFVGPGHVELQADKLFLCLLIPPGGAHQRSQHPGGRSRTIRNSKPASVTSELQVSLSHMKPLLQNQTNRKEGGGEEEGEEEMTSKHRDRCRNTCLQSQHLERKADVWSL